MEYLGDAFGPRSPLCLSEDGKDAAAIAIARANGSDGWRVAMGLVRGMNYYIDTEFIDHAKQQRVLGLAVGNPSQVTELISIGMVTEDGREFYAVSNEFDLMAAWKDDWVRCNVLIPLHAELCKMQGPYAKTYHYNLFEPFTIKSMRTLLKWSGNSLYQIRQGIYEFVKERPVFYGYYADYDWVVFCHLFGRMIDLPPDFPMYCRDLKQVMDERGLTNEWKKDNCPDQLNEHNALVDARWNRQLHVAILAQGGEAASSEAMRGDTA